MADDAETLPYLAIVALMAEPAWLGLPRGQRAEHAEAVKAALARHPRVEVEWFDADGLSGRHSDFVTCRFSDLQDYQFLWDALRDLPLFTAPYFRIVEVTLGRRNGYEAYEAAHG